MSESAGNRLSVSRRKLIIGGAATAGLTAAGAFGISAMANADPNSVGIFPGEGAAGGRLADPFTLGVASGDPLPDSVVLWTRLAPKPLADDGLGGVPNRVIPVEWQIAEDEKFTKIVQHGSVDTAQAHAHSVHVEPRGLQPGREYYYRFKAEGHLSPVGRTRTAPAPGTLADQLTMCFASCSNFPAGYFTAYRRIAEDHPELILHLGDYTYEYGHKDDSVRKVAGPETTTLAGYRQRQAQYKTDKDLQAAHAIAPWLVVFDDHEVENNWAGDIPEKSSQTPGKEFIKRRAAAFQAYYENMPLRAAQAPKDSHMQLFRRYGWGELATFHMLDTRQYRDDQACGDKGDCPARVDPKRSLTGGPQEKWIIDGFHNTKARWDVLGQQVFFSQLDHDAGAGHDFSMDGWDGYKANRDRIAAAMGDSKVRNGVVLTGDVHKHWAAEVKRNFDDPHSKGVGTEFVTTSITSGGDGDDKPSGALKENPHIKYYANRRGYVRTKFTPKELRVDYRVLPHVTKPGAEAKTAKSFVVTDRDPSLHNG